MRLIQIARQTGHRSQVCRRCGYQKFWTKRFGWRCGPSCHGDQKKPKTSQAIAMSTVE